MNRVFEVKEKNGRIIYLSQERWLHISKEHPEAATNIPALEHAIRNPTKIIKYPYEKDVWYYYKYMKQKSNFLLIIVKYLNGEGFIITAYFVRHLQ